MALASQTPTPTRTRKKASITRLAIRRSRSVSAPWSSEVLDRSSITAAASAGGMGIPDADRVARMQRAARSSPRHCLLPRGDELLQGEGLGQKIELLLVGHALVERILGIARHEDDLDVGVALAQLLQKGRAVHLRHDHIRDHEIDLTAPTLKLLER